MDEIKNRLSEIQHELANPNVEHDRRLYLLDLQSQLNTKLSEIYAMEMRKNGSRNQAT